MLDLIFHSVPAQLGLAGTLIAGLLAAAYFLPPFRRWLIGAAGVVAAAAAIYAKGARDESKKWKDAERRTIEKGEAARRDAERDVGADPDGVRNDEFNRDKS